MNKKYNPIALLITLAIIAGTTTAPLEAYSWEKVKAIFTHNANKYVINPLAPYAKRVQAAYERYMPQVIQNNPKKTLFITGLTGLFFYAYCFTKKNKNIIDNKGTVYLSVRDHNDKNQTDDINKKAEVTNNKSNQILLDSFIPQNDEKIKEELKRLDKRKNKINNNEKNTSKEETIEKILEKEWLKKPLEDIDLTEKKTTLNTDDMASDVQFEIYDLNNKVRHIITIYCINHNLNVDDIDNITEVKIENKYGWLNYITEKTSMNISSIKSSLSFDESLGKSLDNLVTYIRKFITFSGIENKDDTTKKDFYSNIIKEKLNFFEKACDILQKSTSEKIYSHSKNGQEIFNKVKKQKETAFQNQINELKTEFKHIYENRIDKVPKSEKNKYESSYELVIRLLESAWKDIILGIENKHFSVNSSKELEENFSLWIDKCFIQYYTIDKEKCNLGRIKDFLTLSHSYKALDINKKN